MIDLLGDAVLESHPTRALFDLRRAIVVPVVTDEALYVDFRGDESRAAEREALALGQVGRLLACSSEDATVEETPPPRFPEIVGRCAAMEALFVEMARVAPSDVAVHISGETGTGKERVAEALHHHSPRRDRAFVAVNASSLNDELFESEMFGHARGAFTGAVTARLGLVSEAEGGTLFIDEVADLSLRAQAKLLRFLQQREYRRVGENEVRRADIRIVTAANVDLKERVAVGLFRQDLMYRLQVVVVRLPPLRDRGEDVLRLARHFLKQAAMRAAKPVPALAADATDALLRHAWPGNIRELENEMHRAILLAGGGPLRREHLSFTANETAASPPLPLRDARLAFERDHIERALQEAGGNRARTASLLGVTRQALFVKIRQMGIA